MMNVAGLTPLSTIDYPGELSAVVFCQGCPWRCLYCHNPKLQPFQTEGQIAWEEVMRFLKRRAGLLDAVVFSGGEPTMQTDLLKAISEARHLGFKVGLHTAGINPSVLRSVLPLIDWVGLDIKSEPTGYRRVTGVEGGETAAIQALQLIMDSGVEYEVRTTMHAAFLSEQALLELAQILAELGVKRYVVQLFRNVGCTSEDVAGLGPGSLSVSTQEKLNGLFRSFSVR